MPGRQSPAGASQRLGSRRTDAGGEGGLETSSRKEFYREGPGPSRRFGHLKGRRQEKGKERGSQLIFGTVRRCPRVEDKWQGLSSAAEARLPRTKARGRWLHWKDGFCESAIGLAAAGRRTRCERIEAPIRAERRSERWATPVMHRSLSGARQAGRASNR